MSRPTCVLYINTNHRHYTDAVKIVKETFDTCWILVKESQISDDAIYDYVKPDVVISFLSDRILRGKILELPNINFHPAPPKYPGRGGASYALFNGDKEYGATAHQMVDKIDAGPIYYVTTFGIRNYDCKGLFERAEDECLELLKRFCKHYAEYRRMPESLGGGKLAQPKWNGKAKTRKDFQEFLNFGEIFVGDAYGSEEARLTRLIKACKHSDFPGPYVTLAGYKFELSKNQ